MRTAATILLGAALLAQSPPEKGLFAKDWRARNQAARMLATMPSDRVDVIVLRDALAAKPNALPENVWNSAIGLGGGAGGRYRPDPRDEILMAANEIVQRYSNSWSRLGHPAEHLLVVPWETRELAAWLLETHVAAGAPWRAELAKIEPTDQVMAHAWWLSSPNEEQVLRQLGDPTHGRSVARLLVDHGERGYALLRTALDNPSSVTLRNIFSTTDPEIFDTDKLVSLAVDTYLEEDEDWYRPASHVVYRLGARAIAALAAGCTGPDYRRHRALAMLTVLREHAAPAAEALIAQVGHDEFATAQSLVTLASIDISADLRKQAAEAAMRVIETNNDVLLRVLAVDVLTECGQDVSDAMRKKLQERVLAKPRFLRGYAKDTPRILGCLHRLEAVPTDLSQKAKRLMAAKDFATTDTWLAYAEHGKQIAPRLGQSLLTQLPSSVDVGTLANKLVELDADLVCRILQQPRAWRHAPLFKALQTTAPERVTDEQLLELALERQGVHANLAETAIEWLTRRTGTKHARQILEEGLLQDSLLDAEVALVKRMPLSPTERIKLLTPMLRRGIHWELISDSAAGKRRMLCRQFLAEVAGETNVRARNRKRTRLLEQLIAIGLDGEGDVELVRSGIEDGVAVLDELEEAGALPESLRAFLDQRISMEGIDYWHFDSLRDALLADARHRHEK